MLAKTEKKKEKRRPRNDPQNRNYVCGCGKSYLSYPALYTHQKSKHGKEKPAGTKTPIINGSGHRGRPKKNELEVQKGEKLGESSSFSESDCSDDGLDEFLFFLTNFGKSLKIDESKIFKQNESKNIKQENFSLLLDVAENNYCVLSNFPKEFFVNFEDYLSIYNQIQIFEKSPNLIEQTINLEVIGSKKASLDEIFAIFLIKIAKHLKIPYFKEIALFICIYKKALIEISKLEKETNEKNKLEDSSTELNAEFIIEKSNEFILDLLPKLLPLYKFENLVFLGEDVDQINNAILLTQHFGNWLYSSHFTDSKLEINYSNLNK